jgi:hypothetical protein
MTAVIFFLASIFAAHAPRGSWIGPECSPGGRCRVLREAGPSRHRARRGRHVLVANAPVSHAPHRAQHGPAAAWSRPSQHVLLPGAGSIPMVHRAPPLSWRQPYVHRSRSPWPKRVKLPTGSRSGSDANECDPIAVIFGWELQPTLEHASTARSTWQAAELQVTLATAPGPDPDLPTAH